MPGLAILSVGMILGSCISLGIARDTGAIATTPGLVGALWIWIFQYAIKGDIVKLNYCSNILVWEGKCLISFQLRKFM